MGKRELVALLKLSSWCLVMVERLFLTVPRGCLRFVIVVFPDHTHLLFLAVLISNKFYNKLTPKALNLCQHSSFFILSVFYCPYRYCYYDQCKRCINRGYILFEVNIKYISSSAVKNSIFFMSAQHE